MRIGFITPGLNEPHALWLEVERWSNVLRRMGHQLCYWAGEPEEPARVGALWPSSHLSNLSLLHSSRPACSHNACRSDGVTELDAIYAAADRLRAPLRGFLRANRPDLLIVENILSSPGNLPVAIALTGLVAELGLNVIAHHHALYGEPQAVASSAVFDRPDSLFPLKVSSVQHVTTNSLVQKRLKEQHGIAALVIPNVRDFAAPPPGVDSYNHEDVLARLGLAKQDCFFLQPAPPIQASGVELVLELVHRLGWPRVRLLISHGLGNGGTSYWRALLRQAAALQVDLRWIDQPVAVERARANGHKVFATGDLYSHANLVTCPSTCEGRGGSLLEAVYFKRPVVVQRSPVYQADLKPLGFEFIELDGAVDEAALERTRAVLADLDLAAALAEKNYAIAWEHFSLEVLESKLKELLDSFL